MKRFTCAAVAGLSALALSNAASAAVMVSTYAGAPDPGPLAGETRVISFDAGLEPGVSLTGNGSIVTGGSPNQYAAPAGGDTPYLAAPISGDAGAVELTFANFLNNRNVRQFSFYWGSIDTFNTLQLLNRAGVAFFSISGATLPFNDGDQSSPNTNRRVAFNLTGADQDLGGILFTSTSPAFEVDTFSFAAVPEPSTWVALVLGFFGLGGALRAARRTKATVLA